MHSYANKKKLKKGTLSAWEAEKRVRKKIKKLKNKQKEREKIQNEPCLPGQQTNVFAKKLKKIEKQIKRAREEKKYKMNTVCLVSTTCSQKN